MASLLNQDRSRGRDETVKTESEKLYTQSTRLTGMDGNVVFNYSSLHVSKEATKKTQHLVESTNILNRTFLSLIRTATASKGPAVVRRMYLNSFLSVVKGLKKSIAALEESLKEEFIDLDGSCWETVCEDLDPQAAAEAELDLSNNDASRLRNLRHLAAEHIMGESSEPQSVTGGMLVNPGKDGNSHVAAHTVEDVKPMASESAVSMTKKLVVKLTPVALLQDSTSVCPKQEDLHAEDGDIEKTAPKDDGDGAASHNASAPLLHGEVSESSNRRSPRLKTTPLRRPSDAKVKASHPATDSDLESEGDSAVAPPTNTEGQVLTGDEDDSDSDSVPAALLEAAALSNSSDDEDSQSSTQVAKQRLFWLAKNTPLSADKMRHKRTMLGRSADSGDRRGSSSESSSDGQDSNQEIQHLNTLRPVGKRPLVQRESGAAARKRRKLQPRVTKSTSNPEASDSSSSSSEDQRDDNDNNDEDDHGSGSESDQKMKPITEDVTLLGSAAFHQSSGETCCDPPWFWELT